MRRRRRAITDGAGKMEGVESGSVPRGRSLGGHYSYCFIIGNFFFYRDYVGSEAQQLNYHQQSRTQSGAALLGSMLLGTDALPGSQALG